MRRDGRRWTRLASECPQWCAGGHQCTADYPSGEHRATPQGWRTRYGRFVATRTAPRRGRSRLEVRATVLLSPDEETAHRQAQRVCVDADAAIRAACGLPSRLEEVRR